MHRRYWKHPVLAVRCGCCDAALSRRGVKALLLSDSDTLMVSVDTDVIGAIVPTAEQLETPCECSCQRAVCRACGAELGYHVACPCSKCLAKTNNGHTTIFFLDAVRTEQLANVHADGSRTILTWGDVSQGRSRS